MSHNYNLTSFQHIEFLKSLGTTDKREISNPTSLELVLLQEDKWENHEHFGKIKYIDT